jgi:endonuclease/exonuclease/phosphatase family metal-dependent hydrolase
MSIARDLGMDVQFFPVVRVMEELYGNAILTRWPARLVKAGALPGLRRLSRLEPRGALWSAISVGGVDLQIINTHLGLFRRERARQVDTLLGPDWLGHPDCRDPVILLGDFNARPPSQVYRKLASNLQDVQLAAAKKRAESTFPSRYPAFRLDHIFVSRSIEVLGSTTLRSPLARLASDHLPLVAELNVSGKMTQGATSDCQHLGGTEPQTNR